MARPKKKTKTSPSSVFEPPTHKEIEQLRAEFELLIKRNMPKDQVKPLIIPMNAELTTPGFCAILVTHDPKVAKDSVELTGFAHNISTSMIVDAILEFISGLAAQAKADSNIMPV